MDEAIKPGAARRPTPAALARNVGLNYIFTFLRSLDLTNGLWMVYLAGKGMSLFELGLLEGIYHVSSLLMEVPTGAIADIYGRKTSRILGRLVAVAGTVLMVAGRDFGGFALSFVLVALGNCLESGAGDSLVYDSLKEIGAEGQWTKVGGRVEAIYQTSSILALPLAGFFADRDFDLVFYASCLLALAAAFSSLGFAEPSLGAAELKRGKPFAGLVKQVAESLKALAAEPRAAGLVIFLELTMTVSATLFYYLQNFWTEAGLSKFELTLTLGLGAAAGAFVAFFASRIERGLGRLDALSLAPWPIVACVWGIALTPWSRAFFVALSALESLLFVFAMARINALIPSSRRATILSVASMLYSLAMILLFPLVGWLGDRYSLGSSFIVLAALASLLALLQLLLSGRGRKVRPSPS